VLPATSMATSSANSASSKEIALDVAVAAGKSGLCTHLCWHLDTLLTKISELKLLAGDRQGHTRVGHSGSSGWGRFWGDTAL
jgi:hypothetical protein